MECNVLIAIRIDRDKLPSLKVKLLLKDHYVWQNQRQNYDHDL